MPPSASIGPITRCGWTPRPQRPPPSPAACSPAPRRRTCTRLPVITPLLRRSIPMVPPSRSGNPEKPPALPWQRPSELTTETSLRRGRTATGLTADAIICASASLRVNEDRGCRLAEQVRREELGTAHLTRLPGIVRYTIRSTEWHGPA